MKYSPYFQYHPDEYSKCTRFEGGLRSDIKLAIAYQKVRNFPELVSMCKIYEESKKEKEIEDRGKGNLRGFGPQRPQGRNFKRYQGPYAGKGKGVIMGRSNNTNNQKMISVGNTAKCNRC